MSPFRGLSLTSARISILFSQTDRVLPPFGVKFLHTSEKPLYQLMHNCMITYQSFSYKQVPFPFGGTHNPDIIWHVQQFIAPDSDI